MLCFMETIRNRPGWTEATHGDGSYQISCRVMPRLGNQLARALFINTSLADPNYKSDFSAEVNCWRDRFGLPGVKPSLKWVCLMNGSSSMVRT